METILITGIGLIAKATGKLLSLKGYNVHYLTRNPNRHPALKTFKWNLSSKEIDVSAFKDVTTIIHLAGANIGESRWTKKRKEEILKSRTVSTQLLYDTVKANNIALDAFVAASAIGYYGAITTGKIFEENDTPGSDFLGKTCQSWEQTLNQFTLLNTRTVILRTGVVLAKNESAFQKLIKPFQNNVGASLGSGKQYMPWIHINDIANLYLFCIQNKSISGIFNAVAPSYMDNREITEAISRKLNKKNWLPNIPSTLLYLLFGEMSKILTAGSRVCPKKIIKEGFKFKYKNFDRVLDNLLENN
jgi:uncharacterized protein (TIGR01777 family)